MIDIIKKIIESAIHAPSGENCQPWKFVIKDNKIHIYNLPERDSSLYNWGQRASFIAHGALLENIAIITPKFGYTARIDLFPEKANDNFVAIVTLEASGVNEDPLYPYITLRSTNRKPYEPAPLTEEQRTALLGVALKQEGENARIMLIEDREKKDLLAKAVSTNERILFENKPLHNFFFRHVTWTEEEDRQKKIGFYIKTFELPPPAVMMFKLSRHWNVVQVLNKIGFSKSIAGQNAKVYGSSAAMGVVVVKDNTPEDFITAGRLMQKMWLTTTKMDLSLQPLTGIIFLMQRVTAGSIEELSPAHVQLIKEEYEKIKNIFGITDKKVAMFFRIGKGGDPSARALRLSPEIRIEG